MKIMRLVNKFLVSVWIVILIGGFASPALAFNIFDIDAPAVGEETHPSGGSNNTRNWPPEIIQAIKADQAQAIEKMEKSGFSCWDITRSVSGKVLGVRAKKNFVSNLWEMLFSLFKSLFGTAQNRFDFTGSDTIFGPPCSCPPPKFEKDPITGKQSVVKIFDIFVNDLKYKKSVEAEVSAEFAWNFLGQSWNCTSGNPEGSSLKRAKIPSTTIPHLAKNIAYPDQVLVRNDKGEIEVRGPLLQARGSALDIKNNGKRVLDELSDWRKKFGLGGVIINPGLAIDAADEKNHVPEKSEPASAVPIGASPPAAPPQAPPLIVAPLGFWELLDIDQDWKKVTSLPYGHRVHLIVASNGNPDIRTMLPIRVELKVNNATQWQTTIQGDPASVCRGTTGCSIDGPLIQASWQGQSIELSAYDKNSNLAARFTQ